MNKFTFEAKVKKENIDYEDSGAAVIIDPKWKMTGGDGKMFILIQSWDEDMFDLPGTGKMSSEKIVQLGHNSIRELFGKKIRVTIDIVE